MTEELPDQAPRFILLSYELHHKDGRVSYPLVLINWSPPGSETGILTLHASAQIQFQTVVSLNPIQFYPKDSDADWSARPHLGRCWEGWSMLA